MSIVSSDIFNMMLVMTKKRILVTGGAGFIGSNFCNINKEQYDIVVLDNLLLGDPDNLDADIRFIKGDACRVSDLQACGEKFDIIVHLAGTSSAPMFNGEGLVKGYVNSIESFMTVLAFAKQAGAQKVLYASTSSLYANNPMPLLETQEVVPPNHYAVTKKLYEDAARCFNQVHPDLDIIGFRFMSIYGPNEEAKGEYANIISQFIWDMERGLHPVIYGDGEQFRDFTNVVDVVQGITKAIECERKLGATVFNIGTGEHASFNQIVDLINQYMGKNITPTYIENPVKETYVAGQHADIQKISDVLGYSPQVSLAEGVKAQVEQVRPEKIRKTSSDDFR